MNLVFPPGVKVGYEIEFCTAATEPLSDAFIHDFEDWFEFGYDRSLEPKDPFARMHEVRTKWPIDTVSIDVIDLFLSELQRFKPFVTRNCGLHVHISWSSISKAHILYGAIVEDVVPKFKPFSERERFCSPTFNSSRGDRYNALRWVSAARGHFEVRIFNGSLKLRGIVHPITRLLKLAEKVDLLKL